MLFRPDILGSSARAPRQIMCSCVSPVGAPNRTENKRPTPRGLFAPCFFFLGIVKRSSLYLWVRPWCYFSPKTCMRPGGCYQRTLRYTDTEIPGTYDLRGCTCLQAVAGTHAPGSGEGVESLRRHLGHSIIIITAFVFEGFKCGANAK